MTIDRGVAEFVQQVEGHLLALPWRTRAAIRSDLEQHLAEAPPRGGLGDSQELRRRAAGREC